MLEYYGDVASDNGYLKKILFLDEKNQEFRFTMEYRSDRNKLGLNSTGEVERGYFLSNRGISSYYSIYKFLSRERHSIL